MIILLEKKQSRFLVKINFSNKIMRKFIANQIIKT